MVEAGFTDPRARAPRPSARRLADAVGVSTTTVMDMMHGAADTTAEVADRAAAALRVDPRDVRQALGKARGAREPWQPPAEVNLLSPRQQRALSELILAIAEEREHRGDTTPMTERHPGEVTAPAGPDVAVADELAHRRRAGIADDIAAGRRPAAARTDQQGE